MVDQRDRALEPGDVRSMLLGELSKTENLRGSLDGASPVGEGWACPATLYTATRFAEPGLLLVGDAGSAIDPLSSYGVKKALASGWMAGVAVHTALVDPDMESAALAHFEDREREVYRSFRTASATFFAEAAEVYGAPFWEERAASAEAATRAGGVDPSGHDASTGAPAMGSPDDVEGMDRSTVPEDLVRAAFETIRSREKLTAVPDPTLRRVERSVVRGERIVLADHLASDRFPAGVRWVRGVDLLGVAEVAPRYTAVPDGWAAYNGIAPPVTLPDYLTALSTAFAAGLLTHGEE